MRRPSLTATTDSVRLSFRTPGGRQAGIRRAGSEIWRILVSPPMTADSERAYHGLMAYAHWAETGRTTYLEGLAHMLAA